MNPQLSATVPLRIRNWMGPSVGCPAPGPGFIRVQYPFGNLLAKAKGNVLISHAQIMEADIGRDRTASSHTEGDHR